MQIATWAVRIHEADANLLEIESWLLFIANSNAYF